jgi:DNA-binding transcriptional regulator YdaS (Cro superfamily)
MTLKDYFLSLEKTEREIFAEKCGTTVGQITQIYTGNRTCNPSLAINFDRESNGAISCDELCPDVDFDYLRKQKQAA